MPPPLMAAEGGAVVVDATVRPAPVLVGFGIPRLTLSEVDAQSDVKRHLALDEFLDVDAHDCVRGASWCYLCAVRRAQRAQREGRRV